MQKDAMDVLQAWVDQYNARSGASMKLESGGEAGGAQLRLKYRPADGVISTRSRERRWMLSWRCRRPMDGC